VIGTAALWGKPGTLGKNMRIMWHGMRADKNKPRRSGV
jgi:hypothetical protein